MQEKLEKIILFVFSINLSMHCAVKKLWKNMIDYKSCLQQFDEVYFLRKFNHIDTNTQKCVSFRIFDQFNQFAAKLSWLFDEIFSMFFEC